MFGWVRGKQSFAILWHGPGSAASSPDFGSDLLCDFILQGPQLAALQPNGIRSRLLNSCHVPSERPAQPVLDGVGMNGHRKGELFCILLLIPLGRAVFPCKVEL